MEGKWKNMDAPLCVEALGKWGQTGMQAIIIRRPLCGGGGLQVTEGWVTRIAPSVCQERQKYGEKIQGRSLKVKHIHDSVAAATWTDNTKEKKNLLHLFLNKDFWKLANFSICLPPEYLSFGLS